MYTTPGVYRQDVFPAPPAPLRTGVPVFVGLVLRDEIDPHVGQFPLSHTATPGVWLARKGVTEDGGPDRFTLWPAFEALYGLLKPCGFLADAVRGFFQNRGSMCYVQVAVYDAAASRLAALTEALTSLRPVDDLDLVCVPDIMWAGAGQTLSANDVRLMQTALLGHCDDSGDRFAILDSLPGANVAGVTAQRENLMGSNGALYYPWVKTAREPGGGEVFGLVPPCGHVAGVYSRTDRQTGVHKAPANEVLEGALDLEVNLTDQQQGELNPLGINCLRAFPGRGIRVWGARTLSGEPWLYINVRRLFLTAARWIERNLAGKTFEPNDSRLWEQIKRELTEYFAGLLRQGGLRGNTAQDAFYVKCDEETNPPEVRDLGHVVTDIGLAVSRPNEYIVVRIIHNTSGVTIAVAGEG